MSDYSCFNCDSKGGGYYKAHDGETEWFLGLASNGEAHYACKECSVLLFEVVKVREEAA